MCCDPKFGQIMMVEVHIFCRLTFRDNMRILQVVNVYILDMRTIVLYGYY